MISSSSDPNSATIGGGRLPVRNVLDITSSMAGALAGWLLLEAGLNVSRLQIDDWFVPPGSQVWDQDKPVRRLSSESQARFDWKRLLADYDVVLHDFSESAAADIGFHAADFQEELPQLIIGQVGSWPKGDPRGREAPHDSFPVLAQLGILDEQPALKREGPVFIRLPYPDICAGYLLAAGVLARLFSQARTGQGGGVDTSLAQGALVPLGLLWSREEVPTEGVKLRLTKAQGSPLAECGDGKWLHVMGSVDDVPLMKEELARLTPEEIAQANAKFSPPPISTQANFGANCVAYRRYPRQRWLDAFWAADVPAQPVQAMGELYQDEQARACGYVREVSIAGEKVFQPGAPFKITPAEEAVLKVPLDDGAAAPRFPLQGVKVLDFGIHLAGPFAPMLLSDLGADVIKVEAIEAQRHGEWTFNSCQRGKRAMCINLKSPAGQALIAKLAASVDIVHHNLRLPAAKRLGIDYERLSTINPRLIYSHVSSYGPIGPRKDWPGYDQLFQAASGWELENAGESNPPTWLRVGVMDHQAALASLVATLAALERREITGRGAMVAASLLGASIVSTGETYVREDGSLGPFARLDSLQLGLGPGRRLYRCRDGWLALLADEKALSRIRDGLGANLEAAMSALSVKDGLAGIISSGGFAVEVTQNGMGPFFESADNLKSGLRVAFSHPIYKRMDQVGKYWNFQDLELRVQRPPPVVAQHTYEILSEFGVSGHEIARLASEGVIRLAD